MTGFGPVLGDLEKFQGTVPLLWIGLQAGSGANPVTSYLHSYLKHRKNRIRLKLVGRDVYMMGISHLY